MSDLEDLHVHNAIAAGRAWQFVRRTRMRMLAVATTMATGARLEAGDVDTLDLIARTGDCDMSDITAGMQISSPAAVQAVERLVERGLAHRRDEGTAVVVSLTTAGLETQAAIRDERLAFAMRVLERFEPEDREVLRRLVPRLAGAVAEEVSVRQEPLPPR